MGYSYVTKRGKVYFLHQRITKTGGVIQFFSFKEADSIDLPADMYIAEGPTGLPFAKKKRNTLEGH